MPSSKNPKWPQSGKASQDQIVSNVMAQASYEKTCPGSDNAAFFYMMEKLMNNKAGLHGAPKLVTGNDSISGDDIRGGVRAFGARNAYEIGKSQSQGCGCGGACDECKDDEANGGYVSVQTRPGDVYETNPSVPTAPGDDNGDSMRGASGYAKSGSGIFTIGIVIALGCYFLFARGKGDVLRELR